LRIHRFSSTQFRNLKHEPIELSPGVNLFVGENGQGKTNILEAVHFFKFGRSFRTQRDVEMIQFETPFCRIEVACGFAAGDEQTFAAAIERNGSKTIKIDDKDVARYSELVGRYPCVLFGPQDLELVSGYPAERRRYLDMTGSMTSGAYLSALREYRRVLTQRNAALKRGGFEQAQSVWTEELIRTGCVLVEQRAHLVDAIRTRMAPHIAALGVRYAIEIAYESELVSNRPDGVSAEEQFAAKLAALENEEMRRRTTLAGPHRDDLCLRVAGKDLRRYGSQGQSRLVAVLLRLAEMSHIEHELHEPCVLLLDDLFSELDDTISDRIKHRLDGEHQLFVTSPIRLEWPEARSARVFAVRQGELR
jgi:DNA replication and repair protein RecF